MRGRKRQELCKRGHDMSRWRKGPYGKNKITYCERCRRDRRRPDDKNRKLRKRYGITIEQRDALLVAQGGVCALCDTADFGIRGPMVDHSHKTQRVRGVLCGRCNTNLGWIESNIGAWDKIPGYLLRGEL